MLNLLETMQIFKMNTIPTQTKNFQPGIDSGQNLTCLLPLRKRGELERTEKVPIRPIVTIDDLAQQAEQLLASIHILMEYKHPLAVRRGVRQPQSIIYPGI